jgi:hypothetical protein
MLGGWRDPGLGGHPRYLDIIAVNFYHDNQWELERPRISWEERRSSVDPRWRPLHQLIGDVYYRYQRSLIIGETSHFGEGRGPWIRMIAEEVVQAQSIGVPVDGICLYPIIDRPDWHDPGRWHHSGLWDLVPGGNGTMERMVYQPYLQDLLHAQEYISSRMHAPEERG